MNELINFDDVNDKIITIRNQNVILDAAVAELYGVLTKEINQSIKNNPDKFPDGYIFELTPAEKRKVIENPITSAESGVVKNFDHPISTLSMAHSESKTPFKDIQTGVIEIFDNPHSAPSKAYLEKIKLSPTLPKAFTEKGLYMLATILKSPQATQTTLAIVETFTKLRQLSHNIAVLNSVEPETIEPEVLESTGSLINDLLFSHFPTTSAETSLEFNIGVLKGKRTIKGERSKDASQCVHTMQNKIENLERMIEKINEKLEIA